MTIKSIVALIFGACLSMFGFTLSDWRLWVLFILFIIYGASNDNKEL